MRRISFDIVKNTVSALAIKANTVLRPDVVLALKKAYALERSVRAKRILEDIIENARIARIEKFAICQDTGMPVIFVEIGKDVIVSGRGLTEALQQGIRLGYQRGSLRNSIINDPLRIKKQRPQFGPALIHYDYNASRKLTITVLPKGFGCENKSQLKMFLPTAAPGAIKAFIVEAVRAAGPDACPPYIVGVGIGGTADYAGFLAKKALLNKLKAQSAKRKTTIQTAKISTFAKELLTEINKLNIGPMGLGGRTTALAVSIATYPTHIAGLPVAVNISCHALRSASVLL